MADFEYDRSRAMKQTDFTPCCRCGKGVMHTGLPLFFRITIERMGVDAKAVQRQHGLEQLLGGHAGIAHAMGPDEDMGLPIGEPQRGLICHACAMDFEGTTFAELLVATDQPAKNGEAA